MKHKSKTLCTFVLQLISVCVALSISLSAQAYQFTVSDIRIEGLQRVSASPAFAALPIQAGDVVDDGDIQDAIESLFKTGFFSDIRMAKDGNVLVVIVRERPAISEVVIDGNKAIKTEQLDEVMTENGLAEGEILEQETLEAIVKELERQYVGQGRYSASVETEIDVQPNNQVKVEVNIDEGKVASIKHINIVGNKVFDDKTLLKLFELKTPGWLSWLISDNRYAKEKFKGDIESLESHYLDRGYLDFEVVSTQVSLSPDKRSIYITLNISEGDIYTVNEIELAGDPILPESTIHRMILLRKGETFSQNLMTSTSEYITTLLGNAGYTNAEVKGIPEPNQEDKTVKVTFFIEPSQRVYVRRIEFRGNTRTNDEVLRREMRQMEGASASNALIEQGKVRLERLGFFKEVNVENKEVPGSSDQIDVEYTVEEQPSGSITGTVGYAQGTGAIISASLQQNNWMGTGKQVGVSVNHSEYQTHYNLSYSDPYFTPDGVSRGISLYLQKRDFSKINVASYSTDSYGLNLRFGYPVSEIQRLDFGVGVSHLEIKTGPFAVQEISRSPSFLFQNDVPAYYIDYEENEEFIANVTTLNPSQYNLVADPDGDGIIEDYHLNTQLITSDVLPDTEPGFVDLFGDSFDSLTASLTWIRSTLNRGVLATRGSRNSLSLEIAAPGSDLEYYKIRYEGQYFKPLSRHFTLRLKAKLGYGDGFGGLDRLPFYENFYSGGVGSVRGFRRNSFGPRSINPSTGVMIPTEFIALDQDNDGVNEAGVARGSAFVYCPSALITTLEEFESATDLACATQGIQLSSINSATSSIRSFGGNTLVELGAELIFPIPFLEDQRSTQLAFFLDAGNVFDTDCGRKTKERHNCIKPDIEELNASYGLGLTWISGMGPLTFSVAKALRHDDFVRREVFQFEFGTGF